MILKQLFAPNRPNIFLSAAVLLSTALVAMAVVSKNSPTTQPSEPTARLRAALPKGWSLHGPMRLGRRDMNPGPQWSAVPARYIKLRSRLILTKEGLQREAPPVVVWLAEQQARKSTPRADEDQLDVELKPTEYLGPGAGQHIYAHIPPGAAKIWTTARSDIAKALGVKLATTQPAGKSSEGSIILITLRGPAVSYTFDGVSCRDTKAVAQAMGDMPKDSPLIIQIETSVPYQSISEIVAAAHKLGLTKISISVVRTSRPATKPKKRLPL